MKKILVTGATGFIGNYVVNQLLLRNIEVIATSTNTDKARTKAWFKKVRYIPFDLKILESDINYFKYFDEPDSAIHLAWEGLPNYLSDFHIRDNLPRHYSFLEKLINSGLKDLTVTGTCFEYGMRNGCLMEDMDATPSNSYAIAKNTLRKKLEDLIKNTPVTFKWIRLFYMFGEGQNPKSLFSQLNNAITNGATEFNMSGGEQIRDFLSVDAVAKNVVKIALQNEITGIINCSSNNPISVKELVMDYLKERSIDMKLNLGFYPYADYEPMSFWGDNQKLNLIRG